MYVSIYNVNVNVCIYTHTYTYTCRYTHRESESVSEREREREREPSDRSPSGQVALTVIHLVEVYSQGLVRHTVPGLGFRGLGLGVSL